MDKAHVTVCVCTFRRPQLLQRLLTELEKLATGTGLEFSVVIADNDKSESARTMVEAYRANSPLHITYCAEHRQNIALARNRTLEHATGDYVAFIDDDEFPDPGWLQTMLETCKRLDVAGCLGPVRPHFDQPPPGWIIRGRFCERPELPTGTKMDWEETRTGNVLFRRRILDGIAEPFDAKFGSGGEDKDFFMRMMQRGHTFVWCNEGVVFETVPPDRWTRRYMFRRALLRGRIVLKHPVGRTKLIVTSLVATPCYAVILPVTLLLGQHVFVKYCIKFCDHAGRLLTLTGMNPVNER